MYVNAYTLGLHIIIYGGLQTVLASRRNLVDAMIRRSGPIISLKFTSKSRNIRVVVNQAIVYAAHIRILLFLFFNEVFMPLKITSVQRHFFSHFTIVKLFNIPIINIQYFFPYLFFYSYLYTNI